jgi:outer membrane protein assembly factor BamE (lipoprotein component of BamABCDE complex)
MRRAALGLLFVSLAACTPIYRNHGYAPPDADLQSVVVGKSTRDDVELSVGRPSASGVLTGSAWYYVGSRFRHYGARAPQEVDRQVVAISFDDKGVVENVERFGLEKGRVIVLSRRVTDSNIKGVSFLRQLMGNIGNFNAGQLLAPKNGN